MVHPMVPLPAYSPLEFSQDWYIQTFLISTLLSKEIPIFKHLKTAKVLSFLVLFQMFVKAGSLHQFLVLIMSSTYCH